MEGVNASYKGKYNDFIERYAYRNEVILPRAYFYRYRQNRAKKWHTLFQTKTRR